MTKLYRTLLPGESQENSYDVPLGTGGAFHSPCNDSGDGGFVIGDPGSSVEGVWVQTDALWSVGSSGIYDRLPPTPFPNGKELCGFSVNGNTEEGNFPEVGDPVWTPRKGPAGGGRRNEVNQSNAGAMGKIDDKPVRWISYAFCFPSTPAKPDGWWAGNHQSSKSNHILQLHTGSVTGFSPVFEIRVQSWNPSSEFSDAEGKPLIVELASENIAQSFGPGWPDEELTGIAGDTPYQMPRSQATGKWCIWTMRIKFSEDNDGEVALYVHDGDGVGGLQFSRTGVKTYWATGQNNVGYWKNGGYQQPHMAFWTEMLIGDENETIDSMLDYMTAVTPPAYTILGDVTGSAVIASILPQINGNITGSAVIAATLNTVNPSPDLPAASAEVTYQFTVSGEATITYTAGPGA